ncbi:hypothetical protein BDY24DRAFT_223085 [Mrakia frigida]|uniref:uncharacterized protein n=1 Tax=Mrakia frigida TaxID=29902 RepID=UPI003FCC2683
MDRLPNLDIAGNRETRHLFDAPLPPPPPPSSSSSSQVALPPSSRASVWPFNNPNERLFLDIFSAKAQELKQTLENESRSLGYTFPSTSNILNATFVVLDPECAESSFFRALPPPHQVRSLRWLRQSFGKAASSSKEAYPFVAQEEEEVVAGGLDEGDGRGGRVNDDEEKGPVKGRDFVRGYASKKGWLCSEEEELARFLASDPQMDDRSIWCQYERSHPSRSASAYRERHRIRKTMFFDPKIAELKAANNGQPIEYEHPEVEEVEVVETRESIPVAASRPLPNRRAPMPPPPPPRPIASGFCSNCHVRQAAYWYKIEGKGDKDFCGGCRSAWYTAKRKNPGDGDKGLYRRKRMVLEGQAERSSSSEEEDSSKEESDASEFDLDHAQPHHHSKSTSTSALPLATQAWTRTERKQLVVLLADAGEGATTPTDLSPPSSPIAKCTETSTLKQYNADEEEDPMLRLSSPRIPWTTQQHRGVVGRERSIKSSSRYWPMERERRRTCSRLSRRSILEGRSTPPRLTTPITGPR